MAIADRMKAATASAAFQPVKSSMFEKRTD